MKIGISGLGFVGHSMFRSFVEKKVPDVQGFDKYNNRGNCTFIDLLECDILFLALPTKFDKSRAQYNKDAITETCDALEKYNFDGVIVIKSTVEPGTTDSLSSQYRKLQFVHNPEFLTARTAYEDFHNQTHIVLGKGPNCSYAGFENLQTFYKTYYPKAHISTSNALESESMKSFVNCFYAVKVEFFTELHLLCQSNGTNYSKIVNMMLKNRWINPMHTQVPGPDGEISYGGLCFPKDTMALNEYMKRNNSINNVLNATIFERNLIREDNFNFDLTDKDSEL